MDGTELGEVIIENPTGEDLPCGISVSPKNVEVVVLRSDETQVHGTEANKNQVIGAGWPPAATGGQCQIGSCIDCGVERTELCCLPNGYSQLDD